MGISLYFNMNALFFMPRSQRESNEMSLGGMAGQKVYINTLGAL